MNAESRKWGLRALLLVGVIAAWASGTTGFVVAGVIWIAVGALALLERHGSWTVRRDVEALTNASLVVVGCVAIWYGVR